MPEPDLSQVAQGEQSVQSAPTPQFADTPETTTTQQVGQSQTSDFKTIADLLDIPPELQEQVIPKAEQQKPVAEEKPAETEPEETKVEAKQESEEEDESEEDEGKPEEKPAEQRVDKRQKRINRLTRQKSELEEKLDFASTQVSELREKLTKFEKQAPVGTIPKVGPWMPDKETADTFGDLSQKKVLAKAKLEWCDKHSDGVTIVENGQEKFIDAAEVSTWKRDAQESLMEINPQITVIEREAKQEFKRQRAGYDQLAVQFWPELADKKTEEFQLAASILQEYPEIAHSPSAHYAVGLVIEGMKSIKAKAAKNGNGKSPPAPSAAPKHRDIDERVFTTPRVPIAPHTSGPPSRESSSSSQKQLDEATNSFMNDPDGSAESLAKVFAARQAVAKRPTSRTPVTR